jgi:hypothetical protein
MECKTPMSVVVMVGYRRFVARRVARQARLRYQKWTVLLLMAAEKTFQRTDSPPPLASIFIAVPDSYATPAEPGHHQPGKSGLAIIDPIGDGLSLPDELQAVLHRAVVQADSHPQAGSAFDQPPQRHVKTIVGLVALRIRQSPSCRGGVPGPPLPNRPQLQ